MALSKKRCLQRGKTWKSQDEKVQEMSLQNKISRGN